MSAVPLAVYELSALRATLSRQDMLHAVERGIDQSRRRPHRGPAAGGVVV